LQYSTQNTDVLIVGAGPSGLMMACQLARYGIRFRIIDKKDQPTACSGALILQARSLEIFEQMNIADKAMQEGIIARKINISFNGKKALSLNLKNKAARLTQFPYILMLEQSKTEQLLADFIKSFGFTIERKTELLTFSQDNEFVTSTMQLPDGSKETVTSSYLLAADGGKSLIRSVLNIPFLGNTHELDLFVIDTKTEVDLSNEEIHFSFTKNGSTGLFPLKNRRWRIDGSITNMLKDKESLSFIGIKKMYAKSTLLNIELQEPEWFSVFHSNQRYAAMFSLNRCFLIGDAAHLFSPVGAQGMNSGLQDAYNLAWKLSLVIHKKASESLLSTYNTERQPPSKKIISNTDRAFQLISSTNFMAKFIRLRIAPGVLKFLLPIIDRNRVLGDFLFKRISQISISYHKLNSFRKTSRGRFPIRTPKPGDRLPFIKFQLHGKEVNIQDKLKQAGFQLFIFTNQAIDYSKIEETYKGILSIEVIPFNQGTAPLYKKLGIRNKGYYLIRPDMHIACRSNQSNIDEVGKFLDNYLGNKK